MTENPGESEGQLVVDHEEARTGAAVSAGPASMLILHNVAKKKNFGELLRTAAAMGVGEVLVVGADKLSAHGAHGCASHLRFNHFQRLADCVEFCRNVRGAKICGIEITPDAQPVYAHPFHGSTAFMVGNEGQGLTAAQMAVCDFFVYIPQYSGATASLNVNAACAVVLHHFAVWASIPEWPREGYKFLQQAPASAVANSGIGLKQMRTFTADGQVASLTARGAESGSEPELDGACWDQELGEPVVDYDVGGV